MAKPTQRVIWTAIPDPGRSDATRLRVNLVVTPRLELPGDGPDDRLDRFPAWLDWPATVAQSRFVISAGGFAGVLAPSWGGVAQAQATATWKALFAPDTRVRSRKFQDMRHVGVIGYPAETLASALEELYCDAVAGADANWLPAADDLKALLGTRFASAGERKDGVAKHDPKGLAFTRLAERLKRDPTAKFKPDEALAMLRTYHRPLQAHDGANPHRVVKRGKKDPHEPGASWPNYKQTELPTAKMLAEGVEFHQIVSALGSHSRLLLESRLVIPFDVPWDQVGQGDTMLAAKVEWPHGDEVDTHADVFPGTLVRVEGRRCHVVARGQGVRDGWLRLAHAPYDLLQLDVDGAGLKIGGLAATLAHGPSTRLAEDDDAFPDGHGISVHDPERYGLPALRSAGLALARRRRDAEVIGMFEDAARLEQALDAGTPLKLNAEDVLRGYRVDIHDVQAGRWQSLMRHDCTYRLLRDGTDRHDTNVEGAIRLGATQSPDGSVPDVIKVGEALFAWNGWSLSAPEPGRVVGTDDTVADSAGDVPAGLPLDVQATVAAGSLPILRFGREYRVRLRMVDLAGGGHAWDSADVHPDFAASAPFRFLRYEPLETPPLALVGNAELADRQWDGESLQRAALRTFNATPDLNTVRIHEEVGRHVVPGRVGHRFAEWHGMLDRDGRPDPALYATLLEQDKALLFHVVTGAGEGGRAAAQFTYPVAKPGFELPYLPDPLAVGAGLVVSGVRGIDPTVVHRIPFYADLWDDSLTPDGWPHARPFTIVACEGVGEAKWVPDRREFRIPLPKAERARVRISALLTKEGIERMRLAWLLKRRDRAAWEKIEPLVLAGQHWMFTPWRILELVHAVQKPLVVPHADVIRAQRGFRQTTATLTFVAPVHSKSSARIDVQAHWQEPRDGAGGLRREVFSALAFERRLARLESPDGAPYRIVGRHPLPDTRYRRIRYSVSASTRFREFMPEALRVEASGKSTAVVAPEVVTRVASSAPPPPPSVVQVVPTFGWSRQFGGTGSQTSWRGGGGLRIYLDRPWFASGYNEMLAVVLPLERDRPAADDGPRPAPVTQWGADPIWVSPRRGKLSGMAPELSDFPLAVWSSPLPDTGLDPEHYPAEEREMPTGPDGRLEVSPLWLPEGGRQVQIAPHAAAFDEARGLWFVDVVVRSQQAYFPFIRLALARYQPCSEDRMHLSSAVLTDVQQLAPDRLAVVTDVSRAGMTIKRVAVHGVSPDNSGAAHAGLVQVEVQRLRVGADPDLGWATVPQTAIPAHAPIHVPVHRSPRPGNALEREQARTASQWLGELRFHELLRAPDIVRWVMPPQVDVSEVVVPAAAEGERLRLLVTEWESFPDGDIDASGSNQGRRQRMVYAEVIPIE